MIRSKYKLIIYLFLTLITLAVFGQVIHYDFINIDDDVYVTENLNIQAGITLKGISWAFKTTYAEFWHPLTWLFLMSDYEMYGLNAGGYHLTNVILHILSALLLFWLFHRMTGAVWKSAFVAAIFALHPLHVESVAWISKRRDVLSAFFWMITTCCYVIYTEKPSVKRYLPVLFFFVLALMSKSIVVTLPVIMMLLDYWPLQRFQFKKKKILWLVGEKIPLFVLSAVFSMITLYAQYNPLISTLPLDTRIAKALFSCVVYMEKTFWPHGLAFCYPFTDQLSVWQVSSAFLLILFISILAIATLKRLPHFFIGWLWYIITLLPVLGIINIRAVRHVMGDRYTYLPMIGLGVMFAWSIPYLIKNEDVRKKIIFPLGVAALAVLSILTWYQSGFWKDSLTLLNRTLQVTRNNYRAYYIRGETYADLGKYQLAIEDFNRVIDLSPDYIVYHNRGFAYYKLGDYWNAIRDYNETIRLQPGYDLVYYNKGIVYAKLGLYRASIEEFNRAIFLRPNNAESYYNRGVAYFYQGNIKMGCQDARKACDLGICHLLERVKLKNMCD